MVTSPDVWEELTLLTETSKATRDTNIEIISI